MYDLCLSYSFFQDTMLDINKKSKEHDKKIYEQNTILRCIIFLFCELATEGTDEALFIALIKSNKYRDEKKFLHQTLFYTDFTKHQELCQNM